MRFLRLPQVLDLVAMKRSAWLARVSDGRAPRPAKIGVQLAVWPENVIAEWQASVLEHGAPTRGSYPARNEEATQ